MTNNTSWTNLALTQEGAFSRGKEDSSLAKVGKFAIAKTITTSSFAFAIIETALSTIAQVFLAPIYLVSPKSYSIITQHRKDSYQTAVSAARRTFGVSDSPKSFDKNRLQRLKDLYESSIEILSKKTIETLNFGKEHKNALAAFALSINAAVAYFFFPQRFYTEFYEKAQIISSQIYESGTSLNNWIFQLFSSASIDPPQNCNTDLLNSEAIRDQHYSAPEFLLSIASIAGVAGFFSK